MIILSLFEFLNLFFQRSIQHLFGSVVCGFIHRHDCIQICICMYNKSGAFTGVIVVLTYRWKLVLVYRVLVLQGNDKTTPRMNSKYLLICLLVTIALHLVLGKALVEDCAWLTGRLCTWLHKKRSPGLHAVINVSVSKSCELVYHFSIIRNQWCIFVPVSSIFVDFLKHWHISHWLKELLLFMATGCNLFLNS